MRANAFICHIVRKRTTMPRHIEEKNLPFTPEQLFDLVADIESYPLFLPWCLGARLLGKREKGVTAELTVGFKAFQERFTSRVSLRRPEEIHVSYEKGPLTRLSNAWRFAPLPDGGTHVSFYVDFAFRSPLLGAMMAAFFDKAFGKMMQAFEDRAHAVYEASVDEASKRKEKNARA